MRQWFHDMKDKPSRPQAVPPCNKNLNPKVGIPFRGKLAIVPTPSNSLLVHRLFPGGEACRKTGPKLFPKELTSVATVWRISNLSVFLRRVEVVVKGNWEEIHGFNVDTT